MNPDVNSDTPRESGLYASLSRVMTFGKPKRRTHSKYPGFNRRMLAATIDSIILLIFTPVVNVLAPVNTESLGRYTIDQHDPDAPRRFMLHVLHNPEFVHSWTTNFMMQMVFWAVYSAIFWHFWAATPGKMLLRMKVVNAKDEGPITDLQIFFRSFGYLISASFFCLGFFWIALNRKHRGWHDYLGDTIVVSLPSHPWIKKALAPMPDTEPMPEIHPAPETPPKDTP